jgi:L-asparagine transporter-like permease
MRDKERISSYRQPKVTFTHIDTYVYICMYIHYIYIFICSLEVNSRTNEGLRRDLPFYTDHQRYLQIQIYRYLCIYICTYVCTNMCTFYMLKSSLVLDSILNEGLERIYLCRLPKVRLTNVDTCICTYVYTNMYVHALYIL